MADIERKAQAQWNGELLKGSGKISTNSGILRDLPYSVPSRFETAKGTNPEELLAAAHAGCFSMMLAKVLGDEKKVASEISTKATFKNALPVEWFLYNCFTSFGSPRRFTTLLFHNKLKT